jgi:hypothetical protein
MNLNTSLSFYKSRETILDQLQSIGYDTDAHRLGLEEFQTASVLTELDFCAIHPKTKARAFVLYSLQKVVQVDTKWVQSTVERPDFQKERDTIILVWKSDPSENVQEIVRNWFLHEHVFITWQTIDRTQYNVLKHILVPRFDILPVTGTEEPEERGRMTFGIHSVEDLLRTFCTTLENLPTESRFSPPLMAKLVRPGQVVCYHRPSPTAMISPHWVLCV